MPEHTPPQPQPDRLTDFAGHPLLVGVVPNQATLVALTAASLARATHAPAVYFAYVDTARLTEEELPDGTVRHTPIDPDLADDTWTQTRDLLTAQIDRALQGQGVQWRFRYLAGRVDRALTHLARAIDAAAIIVGTHAAGQHRGLDFFHHSVGVHLAHRQHRPVLFVPLQVVDWKGRAPWE